MSRSPRSPQVALFVTCLADQFMPQVLVAVTKVLEHFGCTVHCPPNQTCCGQPFYNNGYHDEARELAKKLIEKFEDCEYIVTPSASCCAMVRENYPHLLAGDHAWEHGLSRVAGRMYEFVEFLDKVLRVNLKDFSLPAPTKVTYHYTCHQRGIGLEGEALKLLRQIGNVNYVPMEKMDQCCGFGGTFAVKYPAISGAIVEDKVNCIAATGAAVTVVNDAGCIMNIGGACHRRGVKTDVRHIATVIAQAMGMGAEGW